MVVKHKANPIERIRDILKNQNGILLTAAADPMCSPAPSGGGGQQASAGDNRVIPAHVFRI